jgi:two-component system, cell cycle response regulator
MSEPGKDLQVLVVDDSSVYRKLITDTLYYQPYSLLIAKSAGEALELFAKHAPPIVLTDWMMPDLTGLELCQRIRSDSQSSYTYVILLTSMTEKDSVVKGLEAGADDYLTKPFDPGELQARLAVGSRIIRLHRQIEAKNRQLEETSRIDPLTDLPNYRAIQEWATWQLKGAAQHGFPVWVVLADVDGFQKLNETQGREAGDAVLRDFAQIMRDNSRSSDMCGRVTDDEFIFILTHVSKEDLPPTLEKFRQFFERHVCSHGEQSLQATASFGAVGFSGMEAPDFATLIRHADHALFAAKQAGGNQIKIVG